MSAGANSPSSIFARPVNASKFPIVTPIGLNAPVWPRQMMWTLAAVTCGLLIGLARPDSAQNVPSSANSRSAAGSATRSTASGTNRPPAAQARPAMPVVEPALDAPEESRRPVTFYTQTVRSGLFSAPQPPAPAPVKAPAPPPVVKPVIPIVVPPAPIDPFAQWAYTGTITQGDQTIALLENTQTKEGQFLKVGDRLMGAQVKSVTDQMVTLEASGKPRMLAKSDNITVTPLDRSAAPTPAAQPQQPQQGQQPVFNGPVQFNMPAQPMITLPNGVQMSPQRAQRRNRFMNNNFNQ